MENNPTTRSFLDRLIRVLLENFIFYIPKEIINNNVLKELESDLPKHLFDELSMIDIDNGVYGFESEDMLEINTLLAKKKSKLENSIFKLIDYNSIHNTETKNFTIEKYYEYVNLFINMSSWVTNSVNTYLHKEIQLSLVGGLKIQQTNFEAHLKDLWKHFGDQLDFDLDFDFSTNLFVSHYLPDLISRYSGLTESRVTTEKQEAGQIKSKTENKKANKRKSPMLNELKLEQEILKNIFKVPVKSS